MALRTDWCPRFFFLSCLGEALLLNRGTDMPIISSYVGLIGCCNCTLLSFPLSPSHPLSFLICGKASSCSFTFLSVLLLSRPPVSTCCYCVRGVIAMFNYHRHRQCQSLLRLFCTIEDIWLPSMFVFTAWINIQTAFFLLELMLHLN